MDPSRRRRGGHGVEPARGEGGHLRGRDGMECPVAREHPLGDDRVDVWVEARVGAGRTRDRARRSAERRGAMPCGGGASARRRAASMRARRPPDRGPAPGTRPDATLGHAGCGAAATRRPTAGATPFLRRAARAARLGGTLLPPSRGAHAADPRRPPDSRGRSAPAARAQGPLRRVHAARRGRHGRRLPGARHGPQPPGRDEDRAADRLPARQARPRGRAPRAAGRPASGDDGRGGTGRTTSVKRTPPARRRRSPSGAKPKQSRT